MQVSPWKFSFALLFVCFFTGPVVLADPDQPEADSPVKKVMLEITIPASDYIWSIEDAPEDTAVWEQIRLNADKLAESATLLLNEDHIQQGDTWANQARALNEAAGQAGESADLRDFDKLMEAGEAIYNSCEACHAQYQKSE